MDRSREARRSSSMATTNGLPRRRQRSTSVRDSPEEGQLELQETVRLRDRASKRDRDRELLKNRSKRRRGPSREGGEESTEESVGEEEEEEDEEEFQVSDNHRRNFPPARGSRQWKVADKMIGVPVPRKARTASTKRPHENCVSGNGGVGEEPVRTSPEVGSPSSSNVSVRKKMKPGGPPPRNRPSKVSKSSSEDIEIEIAEVLFGLKKQSQSNKTQESNGNELEPRDIKGSPHDSRASFGVGAVEKSSIAAAESEKVESEQQPEKMDACTPRASSHESLESQEEATLKREDSKPSGIGDEKPISAPPCAESDVVFDDLQNSTAGTKADSAGSKQEEKFEIDLMAPPMAASLDREGNGFTDSISDLKAPVKSEEKVERFVMEVVLEEHEEEKKKEKKKKRRETIGEKRELPKLDLEKPNQDSSSGVRSTKASIPKVENTSQSGLTPLPIAVTGWPGGLPPLGYMPPYQTVVPMDGNTASTASLQPPQFHLSGPRPKRCTTHHYIARNIQLNQQFSKMNNLWPAPAATATSGTSKYNIVPCAEKVIVANPFQGSFPSVNINAVQEKGQAGTNFPSHIGKDKGSEAINLMDTVQRNPLVLQQVPHAAPAGSSMHGPAFIFPLSQHPAVAAAVANQSGLSKPSNPAKNVSWPSNSAAGPRGSNSATGPLGSSSVLPAVTTAVSFSYPNFPANEAQYMAILQNNVHPFPISTPVGTTSLRGSTPAQTMNFLNGSFYSSQMFHPSQLQQQQPHSQPVQACHQNTSTSSGSSSSRKQPRGAQVGGNNLLASASMQLQQPHKQHVLPSNQSRKPEVEITAENTPSVADSQSSHAKESVYRQKNSTGQVQPLIRLMHSAGNHGEKQQHGLKGADEFYPSPAFAMSFADFNGNKTAFSGNNMVSTLNFSSLPQNPVIFQGLPDMAQLGYQVAPAPQALQQKTHQVSEGKSGGGSITPNDAKKATSGKPSTTTGQTLVFDNSAKTLSFMSSPVTGHWPPRYVTSTALMTNAATNSQQQQLLQLQVQQHHMLQQQQQQPAMATRSKAAPTTNSLSSSSNVAKFPNNPPVYSQTLIQGNSSVQSSQSKNTGRTSSSLKNMPQQQGRAPQGHTQISFGGDHQSALTPQGQQIVSNNHQSSSSTSVAGTPSTAGNSRTNAVGGKPSAGASINTLQPQQTENSSTRAGQKSSPVCGRNVPSILSTCSNHLSELKY